MGSKLTKVTEGVDTTREEIEEAIEKGEDDARERDALRSALEGVPEDTDDDIAALKDQVEQSGVSEATSDMEGDVRSTLESGKSTGEGVKQEAADGAQSSREAADAYGSAADTKFGGEASDAQSQAESNAEQFDEAADQTQDVMDEGDDDFDSILQRIQQG